MIRNEKLNRRIENYWDKRSKSFGEVRRKELGGENFFAWSEIISAHLPDKKNLKILDVGTGAGFFAVLLSKLGHQVTGVDMSEKMLAEAKKISADFDVSAEFLKMDAQILNFADETFDLVISRNLTWTLPDVMEAYREWRRVLKVGGMIFNFDSDYGGTKFNKKICVLEADDADEMLVECDSIKSELLISTHTRPTFDAEFLQSINFSVEVEEDISAKVHQDKNCRYDSVPLFAIFAKKI